jgi:hypothetical protein
MTTLTSDLLAPLLSRLDAANHAFAEDYPGESARRQPVHTVYGGANLFKAELAGKLAKSATSALTKKPCTNVQPTSIATSSPVAITTCLLERGARRHRPRVG